VGDGGDGALGYHKGKGPDARPLCEIKKATSLKAWWVICNKGNGDELKKQKPFLGGGSGRLGYIRNASSGSDAHYCSANHAPELRGKKLQLKKKSNSLGMYQSSASIILIKSNPIKGRRDLPKKKGCLAALLAELIWGEDGRTECQDAINRLHQNKKEMCGRKKKRNDSFDVKETRAKNNIAIALRGVEPKQRTSGCRRRKSGNIEVSGRTKVARGKGNPWGEEPKNLA